MSVAEPATLADGLDAYEQGVHSQVDDRTREVLEHRRRTGVNRRRGWLVRRLLATADLLGLVAAMLLADGIVMATTDAGMISVREQTLGLVATLPGWVLIAKLYGLYDRDEERTDHSTVDEFAAVFHMVTVSTWLFWVGSRITNIFYQSPLKLLIFWASAITFVTLGRAGARAVARRSVCYVQNTLIVGAGDVGQLIAKKLLEHPEYGINLVGFVDAEPKDRREDLEHVALLGDTKRLSALIRLLDVERVILAFSRESHEETLGFIRELKDLNVQIDMVPRLFERIGPGVSLHHVGGVPLLGLPPTRLGRFSLAIKRALDVSIAALGLLACSPLLVAIAIAVTLTSRGGIIYRDQRIGRRGEVFEAYKFRTMDTSANELLEDLLRRDDELRREFEQTHKIATDPRVTTIGGFLRRWSLDELPQLVNVLKGDVSLVGPRAITCFEYDHFAPQAGSEYYWDSDLRPGITGYWQISGRSSMSYAERVRLDRAYTGDWSLGLDLMILAKTLRVVLSRQGAS